MLVLIANDTIIYWVYWCNGLLNHLMTVVAWVTLWEYIFEVYIVSHVIMHMNSLVWYMLGGSKNKPELLIVSTTTIKTFRPSIYFYLFI